MTIKNMPQGLNGREHSKFQEKVIGGTTYSAVVVTGNLTASISTTDTMSVVMGAGSNHLGSVTASLSTTDTLSVVVSSATVVQPTAKNLNSRVSQTDSSQLNATVNGTVTASISATDTLSVTVGAALPAGTNNIGDVDIASALPAGTNAIGKLAANSGVDIGDVDVTSITNGSLNGPGSPTIDSYTHYAWNLTTGADQVIASSAANKQIWVYGYGFTCGDADGQTVSFQDEDNTAITGVMEFAQYGGMAIAPSGNFAMPIWKLATDKDLEVDITGGDVDGWIAYAVVSV